MSDISDRVERLKAAVLVKPESFIIYDVPYMGTMDNYIFGGFQSTKYGGIALYNGVYEKNTICLSTIIELKKRY